MSNETRELKEFHKLLKVNTNEAYKDYVKAQKKYLSVLTKFIKKEIAEKNNFEEIYDREVVFCLDNQNEMWWAWLEDNNNQIKVLKNMIGSHEFDLLNAEQAEEELN